MEGIVKLSLYLYGDELVSSDVDQRLGIRATASHRKGDEVRSTSGAVSTRRTGMWRYSSKYDDEREPDVVGNFLSLVNPQDLVLSALPNVEKFVLSVFVAQDRHVEMALNAPDIQRLANWGAGFSITVSPMH